MKKLYLYGFIIFLGVVGYFIFWPGFTQVKFGWISSDWPTCEGEFTLSEVSSKEDSDDETVYTFNVLYEYEVNGKQYQNSRLASRPVTASSTDGLSRYLRDFPKGASTDVYYNPNNPTESIILPGSRYGSWFLVILGGLVWLFGFWILIMDLFG